MNITLTEAVLGKESFDPDLVRKYWHWLVEVDSVPILCTSFGHIFLEHVDGSILFLDTWTGMVHEVCDSYAEFKYLVANDQEFFSSFFWVDLLSTILSAGVSRASYQCFSPIVSPGLGGSLSAGNFSPASLNVHLATMAAEQLAIRGRGANA